MSTGEETSAGNITIDADFAVYPDYQSCIKQRAWMLRRSPYEPHLSPYLNRNDGSYSKEALATIDSLGYKTIIWNIDSLDWKNPGRDVIIDRVVKRLKPGGIILMHASDTPQQTAEALPILLEKIKAEGYTIVTVGELLQNYAEGGIKRH